MPEAWTTLFGLALGLGARHGFDADHLTVIDAIARRNLLSRPALARLAGVLFSLGHGLVVCGASAVTISIAAQWRMPTWLSLTGAILSIAILLGLASVNLTAALFHRSGAALAPVGLKSRFFPRSGAADHPLAIMATGMVFALSFDTLTQTAALSVAGSNFGGVEAALAAAGCFMLGMLVSSGLNGLWITHLIGLASKRAALASRLMVVVIGTLNLVIGLLAFLRLASPQIDAWSGERELFVSGIVIAAVAVAFLFAMRIRARSPASPSEPGGGTHDLPQRARLEPIYAKG